MAGSIDCKSYQFLDARDRDGGRKSLLRGLAKVRAERIRRKRTRRKRIRRKRIRTERMRTVRMTTERIRAERLRRKRMTAKESWKSNEIKIDVTRIRKKKKE